MACYAALHMRIQLLHVAAPDCHCGTTAFKLGRWCWQPCRYGLYFGVLGRDCAEVASDRMVSAHI